MGKDTTAFKLRFEDYKNGKPVSEIYDAGLPKYSNGTPEAVDDATLDFIINHEGYQDHLGHDLGNGLLFIGSGLAGLKYINQYKKTGKWSKEDNRNAVREVVLANRAGIRRTFGDAYDRLTAAQKGVLDDIAFNIGVGKLNSQYSPKFVAAVLAGNMEEAKRQMDWGNHLARGLVNRNKDRLAWWDSMSLTPVEVPAYIARQQQQQLPPVVPELKPYLFPYETQQLIKPLSLFNPTIMSMPSSRRLPNDLLWSLVFDDKPKQDDGLLYAKNGKLPRYGGGKLGWTRQNGNDIKFDEDTGELVDQVTGEKGALLLPEVTITPKHYDAYNSTYDPNLIRNFTDFAPVVGDIGQGLDAYNAFKNKDYTSAAILGGLTLLPNAAENFGKYTYKSLRHLGISQDFAKEILLNSEAAWKRFKNLDIFDKIRGIKYTDDVYHGSRNAFDINHARAYAPGGMDTGFHMGSSPTPAYSRANGLLGGVIYPGKLKLKEEPFELNDLNRWGWREIVAESDNNPAFKKYLEDKEIDIDRLSKIGSDLDDEYFKLNGSQQEEYLKKHGGFLSDRYMADLFKKKNVSFKYKNNFEKFDGVPEYSYAIYNPENTVWNRPFTFSKKLEDLEKLYDLGMANKYNWNNPDEITVHLEELYRTLKDFPKYRLPGHKNGKLPSYSNGKISIKPANRGKLTRLKARTGKSESELYNDGNPAHKKMVVFARNARKWKH